jgi:hypothetical protein
MSCCAPFKKLSSENVHHQEYSDNWFKVKRYPACKSLDITLIPYVKGISVPKKSYSFLKLCRAIWRMRTKKFSARLHEVVAIVENVR